MTLVVQVIPGHGWPDKMKTLSERELARDREVLGKIGRTGARRQRPVEAGLVGAIEKGGRPEAVLSSIARTPPHVSDPEWED